MKLVERHIVKSNNQHFADLLEMTHLSKNLYNQANYFVRRKFVENRIWLRYCDVDKLCKNLVEYNDYRLMPSAKVAQQVLRSLDKNWTAFFRAIKDWKKHPSKFL